MQTVKDALEECYQACPYKQDVMAQWNRYKNRLATWPLKYEPDDRGKLSIDEYNDLFDLRQAKFNKFADSEAHLDSVCMRMFEDWRNSK